MIRTLFRVLLPAGRRCSTRTRGGQPVFKDFYIPAGAVIGGARTPLIAADASAAAAQPSIIPVTREGGGMRRQYDELALPPRLLLGAGPSNPDPRVLRALALAPRRAARPNLLPCSIRFRRWRATRSAPRTCAPSRCSVQRAPG